MFERLISERAAKDKGAIAMATPFDRYSYAEMDADIRRCVARLRPLGLRPGSRALIQVSDLYTHWLLTFALEALGVVTMGVHYLYPVDATLVKWSGVDFVFADRPLPPEVKVRSQLVGPGWMKITRRFRPLPLPSLKRAGDDPVRLVLSSGTTGTPKKVMLTREMIDRRNQVSLDSPLLAGVRARFSDPDSLAVITETDPSTVGGLGIGVAIWTMGGRLCQRAAGLGWAETLTRLKISCYVAAPLQIQGLLDALPADFRPPVPISLGVIGGSLSKPLAAEVKRRLTSDIFVFYGTTESGGITEGHMDELAGAEDAAGHVHPSATVELVRPDGARAAAGELGEVRVRGACVVDGYFEQPEETQRYFKDGWYHPGDLAVMDADGTLRVMGRTDDLMNIGGVKFLPAEIETLALKCDGVRDAAAFSVKDAVGLDRMHVIYIADRDLDADAIKKAVAGADRHLANNIEVARTSAIPRNALGKVERVKLRNQVLESAS